MTNQIKSLERNVGASLADIITNVRSNDVLADLSQYEPIKTGFELLDNTIGGGLKKNELILIGGPPGVGKTIASLQIARNIASQPDQIVYYLSYEHSEIHLVHRLLCLESIDPTNSETLLKGVSLRHIDEMFSAENLNKQGVKGDKSAFMRVLGSDQRTLRALKLMQGYARKLIIAKASSNTTDLDTIRSNVASLCRRYGSRVTVMVDYLQKVPVRELMPESERITVVAEGLKDLAMQHNIPVWAVVAADREGLQAERMRLYHLRGSSALEYEADIALIMSNKYTILREDLKQNMVDARKTRDWVVFTVEKNRAGVAFQELEFQLHARYFTFNPEGRYPDANTLIGSQSRNTHIGL